LDEECDEILKEIEDMKNPCVQYLSSYEDEDSIGEPEDTQMSKNIGNKHII
jgi:hypothetical protein